MFRRPVYTARRSATNPRGPSSPSLFCSELRPEIAALVDMCCSNLFKFRPPPSVTGDPESATYTYENTALYEYRESALLAELRDITISAKCANELTDDTRAQFQKMYNRPELVTHGILDAIAKLGHGQCPYCDALRAALVVQFVYCPVGRDATASESAASAPIIPPPPLRVGFTLRSLAVTDAKRHIFDFPAEASFSQTQLSTFRYWAPGRPTTGAASSRTVSGRNAVQLHQYSTAPDGEWCLCKLAPADNAEPEGSGHRAADLFMITRRPMLSCVLARLNLLAVPQELSKRIRLEYMIRPFPTARACLDALEIIHTLTRSGDPCCPEAIVQGIWDKFYYTVQFFRESMYDNNNNDASGDDGNPANNIRKHVIPCVKVER